MRQIKFVSIGDLDIGKTRFFNTLINFDIDDYYSPTIGVSYFSINHIYNDTFYQCSFWDTSGGERYQNLIKDYIIGSCGCILFFDYNDLESIQFITNKITYLKELNPSILLFAIGFNYEHSRLNDMGLLVFLSIKKCLDVLKIHDIPIYRLKAFKNSEVSYIIKLLLNDFISQCIKKNITIIIQRV